MPRKAAVVTGGAVRLGRAVARRLAREGWDLVLHYHSSREAAREAEEECREAGARVRLVQADLSRAEGSRRLCREAREAFEGVDLLVNNAAVFPRTPTLAEAAEAWEEILAVNLRAPFLCAAGLAEALAEREGSIVFVADIYGRYPLRGYLPYCVAKAGVIMLTRALALELAPRVRVNAVAPGAILPPEGAPPEWGERLVRRIPRGRLGDPEDIASAVSYLASAGFVTGQVLAVDGGRTVRL